MPMKDSERYDEMAMAAEGDAERLPTQAQRDELMRMARGWRKMADRARLRESQDDLVSRSPGDDPAEPG
jgi:hypothetical protein